MGEWESGRVGEWESGRVGEEAIGRNGAFSFHLVIDSLNKSCSSIPDGTLSWADDL